MEIDYSKDPQQARCAYDIFGVEIYPGEDYWQGDEGIMADPGTENYNPDNQIVTLLVQQLGTRHILEALGYGRKTLERM